MPPQRLDAIRRRYHALTERQGLAGRFWDWLLPPAPIDSLSPAESMRRALDRTLGSMASRTSWRSRLDGASASAVFARGGDCSASSRLSAGSAEPRSPTPRRLPRSKQRRTSASRAWASRAHSGSIWLASSPSPPRRITWAGWAAAESRSAQISRRTSCKAIRSALAATGSEASNCISSSGGGPSCLPNCSMSNSTRARGKAAETGGTRRDAAPEQHAGLARQPSQPVVVREQAYRSPRGGRIRPLVRAGQHMQGQLAEQEVVHAGQSQPGQGAGQPRQLAQHDPFGEVQIRRQNLAQPLLRPGLGGAAGLGQGLGDAAGRRVQLRHLGEAHRADGRRHHRVDLATAEHAGSLAMALAHPLLDDAGHMLGQPRLADPLLGEAAGQLVAQRVEVERLAPPHLVHHHGVSREQSDHGSPLVSPSGPSPRSLRLRTSSMNSPIPVKRR